MRRTLEQWYRRVNGIYFDRNFYRSVESIFCHVVEVSRSLGLAASKHRKRDLNPEDFLPKTLAWWFALCGTRRHPKRRRHDLGQISVCVPLLPPRTTQE
jgi:hypothetical protein